MFKLCAVIKKPSIINLDKWCRVISKKAKNYDRLLILIFLNFYEQRCLNLGNREAYVSNIQIILEMFKFKKKGRQFWVE